MSTYPSTVVSEPHCPAQFFLESEDARSPSSLMPCDLGRCQTPAMWEELVMLARRVTGNLSGEYRFFHL